MNLTVNVTIYPDIHLIPCTRPKNLNFHMMPYRKMTRKGISSFLKCQKPWKAINSPLTVRSPYTVTEGIFSHKKVNQREAILGCPVQKLYVDSRDSADGMENQVVLHMAHFKGFGMGTSEHPDRHPVPNSRPLRLGFHLMPVQKRPVKDFETNISTRLWCASNSPLTARSPPMVTENVPLSTPSYNLRDGPREALHGQRSVIPI